MSTEPPKKKRKVAKNKKKTWRKHIDISEIEEFLEDERLQERTGGKVSLKGDDELFFVESKLNTSSPSALHGKRKWQAEPLRSYASLEREGDAKPALRQRTAKQQTVKQSAASKPAVSAKKSATAKSDKAAVYDLWGADDTKPDKKSADNPTKKPGVKPPAKTVPSLVAAVEPALPGQSYNPAMEDYEKVVAIAAEEEEKKQKVEQRIARALDKKFPKASQAPSEESWLQEMSEGLFDKDSDGDAGSDEEEDGERQLANATVRREDQKSMKQRKQEKLEKDQERQKTREREKRMKENDIFRLKTIKAEIGRDERKQAEKLEKRLRKEEEKKSMPRKLGRQKFEKPNLEVKLADELPGSLRRLKPEGNVLEDRFHSLQKRNIIETRRRAKFVRRYTPKTFEKKGHKEVTTQV